MSLSRILLTIIFTWIGSSTFAGERPNILLIMSDDMGYSDLGCYGGVDAKTPHLDSLAQNGVRFTQFYNTARCCPTRASLLTGLYPHQAGVGHMTDDRGTDGYRGDLNRQCATIAEVLKPAGYRTYMTGKWHVTKSVAPDGDQTNWPLQRGFDKYYGTLVGAGNFFNPNALVRQNTHITAKTDPEYQPSEFYYTDALSDNAIKFLRQHRQETPEQPFFLYVAYTAAHWPMQALEKDIAKYRGKFDDGYAPHRAARLDKMKQIGFVPPQTPLSPAAEDWSKVANKAWEARCMEVYCAMIDNMDAGIGRIVAQLKESGQLENTLILFLQDNGACAETVGRTPGERRGERFEGRPLQTGPDAMPGPGDTFIAYGRGWANVSNTPFREYKHWVHEGGISTPLVAHWPKGISADRAGKLERQPGHLIDIMATCVDVAGAEYPTERNGEKIKPREGVSLRPALSGELLNRKEPIYWEHEANRAVRDCQWKLVAKANQPWELYDIDADRTESKNLAAERPELVKKMSAQWDAYAARANVLPLRAITSSGASPGDSKTTRFELAAGTELQQDRAPALNGRGLTITAKVTLSKPGANGVILAQGGARLGYSLYLKEGRPIFAVRAGGGLKEIESKTPLTGAHQIIARLSPAGRLSLEVDGKSAAEEIAAALIADQPVDGLSVGRDTGGAVGSYRAPNGFKETIESLTLEMEVKAEK